MAKRKLAKTQDKTSLRKYENITAKDIFDEAKAGDAVALLLVDEVGEILGSTLSNIACVVNPEVIVIGGGVSKAGQILIDTIKKHYQETSLRKYENITAKDIFDEAKAGDAVALLLVDEVGEICLLYTSPSPRD